MPIGEVTRGTTGTNRLRRVDRFLADLPALTRAPDPLVIDLGYGASGVTAFELAARLRRVRPDVEVLGLEIDPARVHRARQQLAGIRAGDSSFVPDLPVDFALGGFEIPAPGGRRPALIRAFNVLRQYSETDVAGSWATMTRRLQPGGLLVEGTCNETGRVASWVTLDASGPRSFTLSLRLTDLDEPSIVAERLPKILIHRNVPGERIHELLRALDRAWRRHAILAPYGPRQRWLAATDALRSEGWNVLSTRRRRRLGELTVSWTDVAPAGFAANGSAALGAQSRKSRNGDG